MRTEIKAAIVVGLVVFVGALIWALNSSKKADKIPFDLAPGETPVADVGLASDERAVPGETVASGRGPTAPGRTEEPSVLSYEPIQPRLEAAARPEPATGGTEAEQPPAGSEPEQVAGGPAREGAPPTEPPARTEPTLPTEVGPRQATGSPDVAARVLPGEPAAPPEDVASRLEGLRKPATGSTYTIQLGDTLIAIARERYGQDRYWTAIQAANPDLDPLSLQAGQVIVLPPKEQVVAAEVKPATERKRDADRATYVVEQGDTLIAIARNVLKDESRYLEIFELNRDELESPDLLIPGMELRLPPLDKKPAPKNEE